MTHRTTQGQETTLSETRERPAHNSKRRCTRESPYGLDPDSWRGFFERNPWHRTSRSRSQTVPDCLRHHFARELKGYCPSYGCPGCKLDGTKGYRTLLDHTEYIEGWTEDGRWTPVLIAHPYMPTTIAAEELKKLFDESLEPHERNRVQGFVGDQNHGWYATGTVVLIQPSTCAPIAEWIRVD